MSLMFVVGMPMSAMRRPQHVGAYVTSARMERQSGLFLLHLFRWAHFHLLVHTFFLVVLYSICCCVYLFVPV